jgi:hypothetical protein
MPKNDDFLFSFYFHSAYSSTDLIRRLDEREKQELQGKEITNI